MKNNTEKEKKKSPIAVLMEWAGSHSRLTAMGCALSGLSAAIGILTYVYIWMVSRGTSDTIADPSGITGTVRYGWMALLAAIISAAIYFAGLMCTHLAAFRTATNMRKIAARHLIDVPLGYFHANESGKIRKQIDDNAALTETLLAHNLPDAVAGIVTPVFAVILLFIFDWRMGVTCLIPMLVSFALVMSMMSGASDNSEEAIQKRKDEGRIKSMDFYSMYQRSGEKMAAQATEYVRGIPVVKVFQQTVHSFKSFYEAIQENAALATHYALACARPYTWFTVILNASFLFLIPVGMIIIRGAADPWKAFADLVFYIFFAPQLAFMMDRVMYVSNAFMDANEATTKLNMILKVAPLPEVKEEAAFPDGNDIVLEDVSFTYEDTGHPALSHVSLKIPEGCSCALVGPSGGGKTTLARLIPRFFDVSEGSVRIGGADVRDMTQKELMDRISFVFQDAKLFKKSIRENIAAAKENATEEEILAAAHAARCDDILEKMPDGLDTVIGKKGVYLSGGECQRIALARAILKDAPIVILDEASAFADPENEALIQKGFEALMKNKTVLMIAHRLSTVRHADRIFVLTDGEIAEEGTHEELMAKNGVYASMWEDYQKAAAWKIGGEKS